MKIITFCIALLISSATFAGITIKQISTLRKMVIATDSEKKSSVKKGSEFVATFQDNTQCTMEVVKVRGKKIFLDAGLCKVDLLRKGQTLQASAFDNEDGQITSKHMADSSGSLLTSETGKATGKRIADSHLEEFKNNTNRQESWYTMWNYAPLTSVSAGEDIERKFKSNTTFFGLDVLGFYWPMFTKGLIVGGVFNYYNYSDEAKEFSFSILEAQNYNTSALYFLGGEIGRGFFVRGDLGVRLARFEYAPKVTTIEGVTSLGPPVEKDDVGLNAALGLGGSMPVSREVRLLFQVIYSTNLGGDINAPAIQFLVGVLL